MCIFALRPLRNRPPTKDNLVKRSIIQPHLNVRVGGCGLEDNMNHVFMGCETFCRVWVLLRHWLDIHSINPSYLTHHIVQFSTLRDWSKKLKSSLHIVCVAYVWVI